MSDFEKKDLPASACIIAMPNTTVEFVQGPIEQKLNGVETISTKSEIKSSEKRFADEFNNSEEIQREFGEDGLSAYIAFRKAQEEGRVRIFSR
jgi:hypothetical protein